MLERQPPRLPQLQPGTGCSTPAAGCCAASRSTSAPILSPLLLAPGGPRQIKMRAAPRCAGTWARTQRPPPGSGGPARSWAGASCAGPARHPRPTPCPPAATTSLEAEGSMLKGSRISSWMILTALGQRLMLMMMVARTQTHLHQPWRLDRCNHSLKVPAPARVRHAVTVVRVVWDVKLASAGVGAPCI